MTKGCMARSHQLVSLRFFFSSRRRHTRYWRDWSSDVCSSDLARCRRRRRCPGRAIRSRRRRTGGAASGEIGRASCRERVEMSADGESLKKEKRDRQHERELEGGEQDELKKERAGRDGDTGCKR